MSSLLAFHTTLPDGTPLFHLIEGTPLDPDNLYLVATPAPDGDIAMGLTILQQALAPGWECRAQPIQEPLYNPSLACSYLGWDITTEGRSITVYRRVPAGEPDPTGDLRALIPEAQALVERAIAARTLEERPTG